MAANSKIEWTEWTWNPVTGCTKISPGCLNCYAERMARRLQAMGQPNYRNGFQPHVASAHARNAPALAAAADDLRQLDERPVPQGRAARFHPEGLRRDAPAPQHRFQILTKRSERLAELSPRLPWPDNVWMGVTVENSDYTFRIDHLRQTGAAVKFLSFEPLLSAIPDLDLNDIDWVIVGGESGPGARPMPREWVTDIRDQCLAARVPFFFKQWGGINKKANGRTLENKTWDQIPQTAMPRRHPAA